MDIWIWAIVCALAVMNLIAQMEIIRLKKEMIERLGSAAASVAEIRKDQTAMGDNVDLVLWPEVRKLTGRQDEMKKKLEAVEARMDELPTEQIQGIYDAEKQFQDGLNAILGYYGETKKE